MEKLLVISIEHFKEWLKQRNMEVAGWACTGGDCPLARYILVTHEWARSTRIELSDDQHVTILVNGEQHTRLDNEQLLTQFVLQLDNAYPRDISIDGDGWAKAVTGLQALAVLESL